MDLEDIASVLADAAFFEICDAEQRRLLAFASEVRAFGAGELLFRAGDMSDGAYVLMSGTLVMEGDLRLGVPHTEIYEQGALIGELGLLLERPRRTTISVKRAAELLFVPRTAFSKLVRQYPGMAEKAAERISEELQDYVGALKSVQGRMQRD